MGRFFVLLVFSRFSCYLGRVLMRSLVKNFIFILLIFLVVSGVFTLFSGPTVEETKLPLTQVVQDINQGKIKKIVISGNELEVVYMDDSKAKSRKEGESALSESLINYGVNQESLKALEVETTEQKDVWSWLGPLLFALFPLLLFGVFFFMKQEQPKLLTLPEPRPDCLELKAILKK